MDRPSGDFVPELDHISAQPTQVHLSAQNTTEAAATMPEVTDVHGPTLLKPPLTPFTHLKKELGDAEASSLMCNREWLGIPWHGRA